MTSNRHARIRPVWVPALLLAIPLMAAALAACSGECPRIGRAPRRALIPGNGIPERRLRQRWE